MKKLLFILIVCSGLNGFGQKIDSTEIKKFGEHIFELVKENQKDSFLTYFVNRKDFEGLLSSLEMSDEKKQNAKKMEIEKGSVNRLFVEAPIWFDKIRTNDFVDISKSKITDISVRYQTNPVMTENDIYVEITDGKNSAVLYLDDVIRCPRGLLCMDKVELININKTNGIGQESIDTSVSGFSTPEELAKSLFSSFQNFNETEYMRHAIPLDAYLYLYKNHYVSGEYITESHFMDSVVSNYPNKLAEFIPRANFLLEQVKNYKKIRLNECKIIEIKFELSGSHYWPYSNQAVEASESFRAPFAYVEIVLENNGKKYYLEIPQVVQLMGKWYLKYPEYHIRDQVEHEFILNYLKEEEAFVEEMFQGLVEAMELNDEDSTLTGGENYEHLFLHMTGTALYENGDTAVDYLIYSLYQGDTLNLIDAKENKFEVVFDLGKKYLFGFKKEGYVSKHLILDIVNCGEYSDQKYGFEFPMELKFIQGDHTIPSRKVATIGYNPETGYMEIINRAE